jgi:hypothetical protein
MMVRSPSRFTGVLLVGVLCVVAVWHESAWAGARSYVHQRVPVATLTAAKQHMLPGDGGDLGGGSARPVAPGLDTHETPRPGEGLDVETPDAALANSYPDVEGPDVQELDGAPAPQTESAAAPPWETVRGKGSRLDHEDASVGEEKAYMEEMLDWHRPGGVGHWPPFDAYIDKAYDPNRWEEFDQQVPSRPVSSRLRPQQAS